MSRHSAGILLYDTCDGAAQVLLVHPGGPLWRNRDAHAWSIPKGEYEPPESPRAAAIREFHEETGLSPDDAALVELGEVRQRGGKVITAWAARGKFDASALSSNHFEMEWPPKSGHVRSFPEVDRAGWFAVPAAREKINVAQAAFLDRLLTTLGQH